MTKNISLFAFIFLTLSFWPGQSARAQEALHVVKSGINAESENAEFCLEFDKALALLSPDALEKIVRLESDDKAVHPENIVTAGTSLCIFPLLRGQFYRLTVEGLRGADDEKLSAPYSQSFTIPNRSPMLAFTASNGGINTFGDYDKPLLLRAVNVPRVKMSIYRVTDPEVMVHIWQERAQTSLAPSESAYLARDKGKKIWEGEESLQATANATVEQPLSLHDKAPDLPPGIYLIIADAEDAAETNQEPASKGLKPMAAAWFAKSNFALRAIRDDNGIHVFARKTQQSNDKDEVHFTVVDKQSGKIVEAQANATDETLIPYPSHFEGKDSLGAVMGGDKAGNVAFADIESLPVQTKVSALGVIDFPGLFASPNDTVAVSLSMPSVENAASKAANSVLRLSRGENTYVDLPVPELKQNKASVTFTAPSAMGLWNLNWLKADGNVLASEPFHVTANADAPYLQVKSDRDALNGGESWAVSVQSITSNGKHFPLVNGHASIMWQKLDPATLGWKDYSFGVASTISDTPVSVADFITDLEGDAQLHLELPLRPAERGLYQGVLKVMADADSGVAAAPSLVLPLRPEGMVVGIKPLAGGEGQTTSRFAQNGIARFALIALSSDGKPRNYPDLSYQVYEEGRSFTWHQSEGRWQYKPDAQLRPIGGGDVSIKAEGSVLEWPVTAGNYRLEILDQSDKVLAQVPFSAGWDAVGTSTGASPLEINIPKSAQRGKEVVAHFYLPESAIVTAVIADANIRKTVHELRDKGDNSLNFTPAADWQGTISLSIEAATQGTQDHILRGKAGVALQDQADKSAPDISSGVSVIASNAPEATIIHKDEMVTLVFGVENLASSAETYHYSFSSSGGLKIENGQEGSITLGARQSQSLSVTFTGVQVGDNDLRLDVSAVGKKENTAHASRNWTLAVLSKTDYLHSSSTFVTAPNQSIFFTADKNNTNGGSVAFIAHRSMDGLGEILSFLFKARPFTTEELALSIDALRQWGGTMAQAGIAPDFLISAHRNQQISRLLGHQNTDGGFSALHGGDSTLEDTANALLALGPDSSEAIKPAKNLAIAWIQQRLSNTWYSEQERAARAAAYAGLAAANAIDPSSLHYFSDTTATSQLPSIAEIHLAAAFKAINDPYAAAFWVKKMLSENPPDKSVALLNAFAATDALSSDDVHAVMEKMVADMRNGVRPSVKDASELLRALVTDEADIGKIRLGINKETREIPGVFVTHLTDATALRNAGDSPLSVTEASEGDESHYPTAAVARHIYRMNGVELSPPSKPLRGEIYMVEIKGTLPEISGKQKLLLQDGNANLLRPLGCPLSASMDTPAFIPWFTMQEITPISACEFSAHGLNVVLNPAEDRKSFAAVYFAYIDAVSVADISSPLMRLIE